LHRKDPKALPYYDAFEASNWTRNDIGVMFWTVAGDNCERDSQRCSKGVAGFFTTWPKGGVGAGRMDKMIKRETKPALAALFTIQLAIALGLFALDILLGPGIGDGIGYSIVLVLCLRNPKRGYALGWAAFTTLLVIAAGVILPDSNALHLDLINRGLEIGTIWAVWFLIRAIVPTTPEL
jgi:hypothetical protein